MTKLHTLVLDSVNYFSYFTSQPPDGQEQALQPSNILAFQEENDQTLSFVLALTPMTSMNSAVCVTIVMPTQQGAELNLL